MIGPLVVILRIFLIFAFGFFIITLSLSQAFTAIDSFATRRVSDHSFFGTTTALDCDLFNGGFTFHYKLRILIGPPVAVENRSAVCIAFTIFSSTGISISHRAFMAPRANGYPAPITSYGKSI